MADDFKVGDVVVRIKCGDPKKGVNRARGPLRAPAFGKMVRVSDVIGPINGEYGLIIEGYPSNHPSSAWSHLPFRVVPPATDEFTARIRACRLHKQEQPA